MKFIGGPAHGQPLPQWVLQERPRVVMIQESDLAVKAVHTERFAPRKSQHPYYIHQWWRAKEKKAYDFYAHGSLTTAEIDKLAAKEFS